MKICLYIALLLSICSIASADAGLELRLRRSVEELSRHESRLTGSAGNHAAADWIQSELRGLGVGQVYEHELPALIPLGEGFVLEAEDESLLLFGMWPNLIRTSTLLAEGIEGELVYGGDGSLLEGRQIEGRMPLSEVTARNIVAVIEGSDSELKNEAIYISAYYEAISPVPALAPGAEQASSAAALLEIARQLKENDHRRTVVLLWTAGHFQNLTGMRHLTPLLLAAAGRRDMQTVSQKDRVLAQRLSAFQIRFAVGLDLSMQSRLAGIFRPGFPLS